MSDLHRLVWRIRGSSVGGSGSWSNVILRDTLETEAIRLTKIFSDLEFEVETYAEKTDGSG